MSAYHQATLFWKEHKKSPEGETLPPVTQDVLDFGSQGSMFYVVVPGATVFYFPVADLDTVAVNLATPEEDDRPAGASEAPVAPEVPEENSAPIIHLPSPSGD